MKTLKDGLQNLTNNSENKNTLVVVGDSYSWGSGIEKYDESKWSWPPIKYNIEQYSSWPDRMKYNFGGRIAKRFGFDYLNASVPGCSNYTISRIIIRLINEKIIDSETSFVVVGWTASHRYEIPNSNIKSKYLNLSPLWDVKEKSPNWLKNYTDIYNTNIYDVKASQFDSYRLMMASLYHMKFSNFEYLSLYGIDTIDDPAIKEYASALPGHSNFDVAQFCSEYAHMLFPCLHPNEELHDIIADKVLGLRKS